MKLSLNDDFVSSLNGKETINVTYLDNSNGSFNITAGGKTFNVQMASTGRWQTAVFEADEISKDKSGAQIALTATNTEITLHMVEVSRRKS